MFIAIGFWTENPFQTYFLDLESLKDAKIQISIFWKSWESSQNMSKTSRDFKAWFSGQNTLGFEDRSTAPFSTARQVQEDPVEFPDAEATGNNLRVRRGLCVELRDIFFIASSNGEGITENGPFSIHFPIFPFI